MTPMGAVSQFQATECDHWRSAPPIAAMKGGKIQAIHPRESFTNEMSSAQSKRLIDGEREVLTRKKSARLRSTI